MTGAAPPGTPSISVVPSSFMDPSGVGTVTFMRLLVFALLAFGVGPDSSGDCVGLGSTGWNAMMLTEFMVLVKFTSESLKMLLPPSTAEALDPAIAPLTAARILKEAVTQLSDDFTGKVQVRISPPPAGSVGARFTSLLASPLPRWRRSPTQPCPVCCPRPRLSDG